VFKLTPPATGQTWTETMLYKFCSLPSCSDGAAPAAGLIFDPTGTVLYGTTEIGGGPADGGTVFQLTPPVAPQTQWTETVLYSFQGGADGFDPTASLIFDSAGTVLYGTTLQGGGPSNGGTVFQLTPPVAPQTKWTKTTLYSFQGGTDGLYPSRLILDATGALYGATQNGGINCEGTVFKLAPPVAPQTQWTETVLYRFGAQAGTADGISPSGGLIFDSSGALYGTTAGGGNSTPTEGAVDCDITAHTHNRKGHSDRRGHRHLASAPGASYRSAIGRLGSSSARRLCWNLLA
jgi:uncharacterized repeat protein (TIGR03803 family)